MVVVAQVSALVPRHQALVGVPVLVRVQQVQVHFRVQHHQTLAVVQVHVRAHQALAMVQVLDLVRVHQALSVVQGPDRVHQVFPDMELQIDQLVQE